MFVHVVCEWMNFDIGPMFALQAKITSKPVKI